MKKKWNLLFLFAFIVSMITLAGCGKTAGEASPYEGKWIAVSAQMIGMSVSVDETFGGAFEFEVKNGGKVSFSVGEVTGNGKWSAKDDKFSLTIEGEEMVGTIGENNISFDDMIELFYSVKSPYRKKAVWVLNEQTVKVLRKLKDNTGNYIWQPAVSSGLPDTILNRPYVTSVYAPVSAAGAKPIAFGDLSYYWIADRQGRSLKRLNELFAMNGQVGFLASQRVDGKLILPEAVKTLTIKKA